MKPLVYLVNVLGIAPFCLEAGRGFGKFRSSTLLSVYSVMMIAVLLLGALLYILGETSRIDVDNVYKFAVIMKSSVYMTSHSGLILVTLMFRSEIIKFLHVLLSFNSSIHNIFVNCGRNFNYINVQVSVLLTLHGLIALVIIRAFEVKEFLRLFYCFCMVLSVLSINLVTALFINLAVLLKRCFASINTCLCDLIEREGEESVGLCGRISDVRHPQQLTEANYASDRPKSGILLIRMGCDFLFDAVDRFNSVFSVHTLVLVAFYVIVFTYDTYSGFVAMTNVGNSLFGSYVWILLTSTNTATNAAAFTVLISLCSCTSFQVRSSTNMPFLTLRLPN
jgi:hypothetical protein